MGAAREALITTITQHIQDGRVLQHRTANGRYSAGPYQTATGPRQFALIDGRNRAEIRRSPRHIAQLFLNAIGESTARALLAAAAEDAHHG